MLKSTPAAELSDRFKRLLDNDATRQETLQVLSDLHQLFVRPEGAGRKMVGEECCPSLGELAEELTFWEEERDRRIKHERMLERVAKAPAALLQEYRKALRVSVEEPTTLKEVIDKAVKHERSYLDHVLVQLASWSQDRTAFEKVHPFRAKWRTKDFEKLVAGENYWLKLRGEAQQALDTKLGDPKLQHAAEKEVNHHENSGGGGEAARARALC